LSVVYVARPVVVRCVNCSLFHIPKSKTCPIYLGEKAIQEIRVREGIPFIKCHKTLIDNKLKTAEQLYASVLSERRRIDATTQTAEQHQSNHSVPSYSHHPDEHHHTDR
jgi:hypothetical protein